MIVQLYVYRKAKIQKVRKSEKGYKENIKRSEKEKKMDQGREQGRSRVRFPKAKATHVHTLVRTYTQTTFSRNTRVMRAILKDVL